MKKALWILILAALPLVAQPVFTADDLPAIGYEATFISDTTDEIIVDVGTTGGPQTWNFSREVEGASQLLRILDPAGTPGADSFPNAEMVYQMTGTMQDTLNGVMWQYLRPTATELQIVGDLWQIDTGGTDTVSFYHSYDDNVSSVFPLQMGATWNNVVHTVDTIIVELGIVLDVIETDHNEVDAWGTIIVPNGTYQTLRYISYDTSITTMSFFFVPGDPDTTTNISYTWVAAEVGPVMMIASRNWETDPDFDTAGTYMSLVKNNIGIAEHPRTELTSHLLITGNEVLFQANETEHAELVLYDALGRSVRRLYTGTASAGEHRIAVPSDLAHGVYFVRMSTPSLNLSARFVVLD